MLPTSHAEHADPAPTGPSVATPSVVTHVPPLAAGASAGWSHLHTDHDGWNTRLVDGRWVPRFPNAELRLASGREEALFGGFTVERSGDSLVIVDWAPLDVV